MKRHKVCDPIMPRGYNSHYDKQWKLVGLIRAADKMENPGKWIFDQIDEAFRDMGWNI